MSESHTISTHTCFVEPNPLLSVYANAHTYRIHSISVNSDQETYISADDLRINLWNLNVHAADLIRILNPMPQNAILNHMVHTAILYPVPHY
ncbi:hypothetical protein B0H14DRAFT_3466058 [Mycena olivaceomarginata]|nr:hypothetical protein B0H14DRAFT_3466058 [Mycena olivaceomarginata]